MGEREERPTDSELADLIVRFTDRAVSAESPCGQLIRALRELQERRDAVPGAGCGGAALRDAVDALAVRLESQKIAGEGPEPMTTWGNIAVREDHAIAKLLRALLDAPQPDPRVHLREDEAGELLVCGADPVGALSSDGDPHNAPTCVACLQIEVYRLWHDPRGGYEAGYRQAREDAAKVCRDAATDVPLRGPLSAPTMPPKMWDYFAAGARELADGIDALTPEVTSAPPLRTNDPLVQCIQALWVITTTVGLEPVWKLAHETLAGLPDDLRERMGLNDQVDAPVWDVLTPQAVGPVAREAVGDGG